MHKTLLATHKESNINILKARDYYFDKARREHNVYRRIVIVAPIALSVLAVFLSIWHDYGNATEFLIGVVSIAAFLANKFLQTRIDANLKISNTLREDYDCKVLGIQPNHYNYIYPAEEFLGYVGQSRYMKDADKYEVWYQEIFSSNDLANAVCMIMDNVIYTMRVYEIHARHKLLKIFVALFVFGIYLVLYFTHPADLINPFIVFLSIFDYLTDAFDDFTVAKDMADSNRKLYENVIAHADELRQATPEGKVLALRCIQDVVAKNRDNCVFISKKVREDNLRNGSDYYKILDKVKNEFWNPDDLTKPMTADDFEIYTDKNEEETVSMHQVHNELIGILTDIQAVLDEAHIEFMLDGGTLIGACREGGFISWDEDVDLAIRSADAGRVFTLLQERLSDKYDIQDYDSEKYYSPRLSRLRVRQKTTRSIVDEKDSELYELYNMRGLFVDIYAYTPILCNQQIDGLYRRFLIHPLYRKIRQAESDWKHTDDSADALQRFERYKVRYMRRANWYLAHAHNDAYYIYEPHYIQDLSEPGPYLRREDMYGGANKATFEGIEFAVPTNPDAILTAYYGPNWNVSPLQSLDALRQPDGSMAYSEELFNASVYKHLKRAKIIYD